MSGVMKEMAGMGMRDRLSAVKKLADSGGMNPGAKLKEKQRSKRGPIDKSKAQDLKRKKRKDAKKAKKKNRRR
jgi:signal recognition particle subunit SRP54